MATFISILILIICILLVAIVLIQNPKGGGLSAEFSGSNQYMGVRKTADFLEKATWALAIALMCLSLVSNLSRTTTDIVEESAIQEQIENIAEPVIPPSEMPEEIPLPEGN
jgi:preprotein translocase subunit SecG